MRTTKLMRFTPWRSFGLRQIAAVRLPRLRISKTLYGILGAGMFDKGTKARIFRYRFLDIRVSKRFVDLNFIIDRIEDNNN
mgnify:CR=1 FL=1